ncbi:MAG: hypothetical protein J4F38_08245 [Pseudomonadales bacterium]|nr:hypothetical protein [Pseudomonadales bacterium]
MTASAKDMIIGAVALIVIASLFVVIDFVEVGFNLTRDQKGWNLDEIVAAVPALLLVTAWFAWRRWRESAQLNGELAQTVAELEDAITGRREMEEQLREAYKMAAMGTLAGGLSHELNNVLQPVITLAQFGLDRDHVSEQERKAEMTQVLRAAERGAEIVKNALALAPGGSRETDDVEPWGYLGEVAARARRNVGPNVEVDVRVGSRRGEIRVNRVELDEALNNLLTNAAEAVNYAGKIALAVETVEVDAESARVRGMVPGDYVRITVADNGPGMSPDVKQHAFDAFFTTKADADAIGLGLSVVYNLARGWGGDATVESEPGEGATFEILIPNVAKED